MIRTRTNSFSRMIFSPRTTPYNFIGRCEEIVRRKSSAINQAGQVRTFTSLLQQSQNVDPDVKDYLIKLIKDDFSLQEREKFQYETKEFYPDGKQVPYITPDGKPLFENKDIKEIDIPIARKKINQQNNAIASFLKKMHENAEIYLSVETVPENDPIATHQKGAFFKESAPASSSRNVFILPSAIFLEQGYLSMALLNALYDFVNIPRGEYETRFRVENQNPEDGLLLRSPVSFCNSSVHHPDAKTMEQSYITLHTSETTQHSHLTEYKMPLFLTKPEKGKQACYDYNY